MPLKLFPSIDGLRVMSTHRFATLWRIERTDGVTMRFTNHDKPITFNYLAAQAVARTPGQPVTGTDEVYDCVDSILASAVQKQAGVADHNVQVNGVVLSSGTITEDDLRKGRYREARVVEMLADWKFPYAGYFYQNVYYISAVTGTRETWQAALSSVPAWMKQNNGDQYTQDCRHDLGDALCKINLGLFTATGTITSVVTPNRVFVASGLNPTADYYVDGQVTFTIGGNSGLTFDVKSSSGGGNLELQLSAPSPVFVGDTFTIVAGCDKLRGTCITKFSNLINFGGFPFMPGNDKMLRAPIG